MPTQINHPDYYRAGKIECSDYIEAFNLNFNLGNVIKYVTRAGKKPDEETLTALKKARNYIDREINRLSPKPDADLLVIPEFLQ
ncbi:MAG: DUF3310 domain-containing protein [Synergistaceae bacterium]|nr:DUF3310 domain-containing protein [Synergistaceae bacterium]